MPRTYWPTRPLIERLLDKTEITETCWLWTGARSTDGYGYIGRGRRADGNVGTHRASHEIFTGPIPTGLDIDHLCRVRHCINPDHLEAVTRQVNVDRGLGGSGRQRKTHCARGHEFTPENSIRNGPKGKRACRACAYAAAKRRRDRLKETAS